MKRGDEMHEKKITVQDLKKIVTKNGIDTNPKSIEVGENIKKLDRLEIMKNKSNRLINNI